MSGNSESNQPLITISTVVFNDKSIEETILSVLPFLNRDVEYIIKDGGSVDGTLDIIRKSGEYVTVISEKDKGIYDAMNTVSEKCRGSYILHLNAGDKLIDLPLDYIKENINNNFDAISFPCLLSNGKTFYSKFNFRLRMMNTLHHQSTFYKRSLVKYDTSYYAYSDFDLNQRFYYSDKKIKCLTSPVVAYHDTVGITSTGKYKKEFYRILIKNSGYLYFFLYFPVNFVRKFIMRKA